MRMSRDEQIRVHRWRQREVGTVREGHVKAALVGQGDVWIEAVEEGERAQLQRAHCPACRLLLRVYCCPREQILCPAVPDLDVPSNREDTERGLKKRQQRPERGHLLAVAPLVGHLDEV